LVAIESLDVTKKTGRETLFAIGGVRVHNWRLG
jgi:hypothetical protein